MTKEPTGLSANGPYLVPPRILLPVGLVLATAACVAALLDQPEIYSLADAATLTVRVWDKNWAGVAAFWGALATHGRAILAVTAILLVAWRGGEAVLRLAVPGANRVHGRMLSSLGLGFGLVALSVLALGLCGLLYPGCLAVAGILMAVGGAGKVHLPTGVLPERRGIFTAAIWASVTALLAMDFLACLSPEWFYDGQIYHLGLPERFLLAHRFAVQPGNMLTFLPLNAEMVYLPALAWGGEEAAKLLNWTWGALLPLAVYELARAIAPYRDGRLPSNVSGTGGAVAALVFVSMPVTLVENEITFSDNLRTLFETLALVWILRARPGRAAAFVLAGAFAGLAMGTKYLSVIRAVLLLGGAAWFAGFPGRSRPCPGRGGAAPVKPVILYAAVAFVAVLPWLARNTFAGRDPVYPFGVGLFASVGYSPAELSRWMADNRHYGVAGLTVQRWLSIPWRVAIRPDTDDFGTFATGPLPVALAVFLLARRAWPSAAILAAVVLGAEALMWSLTSHLIRYLLPALAVMSALIGWAVAEAGGLSRRYARIMAGILFVWAACSFGIRAMNRFNVDDQYGIYGYTLGRFDKATALSGRGYGADFGKLPREGRVLLVGEDRVLGMGRLWTGGSEYNIQAVKAWARESPDSRRFAIKARQAGIGAVVLNVPRFKDSLARGPAFDLSSRELAIVNPWWKGLKVVYKAPPRIGYAIP